MEPALLRRRAAGANRAYEPSIRRKLIVYVMPGSSRVSCHIGCTLRDRDDRNVHLLRAWASRSQRRHSADISPYYAEAKSPMSSIASHFLRLHGCRALWPLMRFVQSAKCRASCCRSRRLLAMQWILGEQTVSCRPLAIIAGYSAVVESLRNSKHGR